VRARWSMAARMLDSRSPRLDPNAMYAMADKVLLPLPLATVGFRSREVRFTPVGEGWGEGSSQRLETSKTSLTLALSRKRFGSLAGDANGRLREREHDLPLREWLD
jgi:hypothetical protein